MMNIMKESLPFTATSFGVRTTSAPSAKSINLLSTDMVSGMVKMQRYPLSRAKKANAIPVFPDAFEGSHIELFGIYGKQKKFKHG